MENTNYSEGLQAALKRAFLRKRRGRRKLADLTQLLLSLTEEPDARAALRACCVDIELLRADLQSSLRRRPIWDALARALAELKAHWWKSSGAKDPDATKAAAAAAALGVTPGFYSALLGAGVGTMMSGAKVVTGDRVLVAILKEERDVAVRVLQRHGLSRLRLTAAISHGHADDPPKLELPPDALVRVKLLNDDYTTVEFVRAALLELFEKTHEEAERILRETSERGVGDVGAYALADAERRVATLGARARDEQMPLRCVMEPEGS